MFKGWKIGLVLALTLALSGCFKVEIETPQIIEQNTFVSLSASTEGEKGEVQFQWLLDGELVENQQDFHTMFTQTGSYELEVVAVDSDANEANQTKTLEVQTQASLNDNFTLNVSVSNAAGFALGDAQVSVLGETVTTDETGAASFSGIPQNALMIVKVEKQGFISQTYQYPFQEALESANVEISLNALNDATQEIDPTIENTLSENELHTRITIPANSFMDAEGNIITDPVDVRITPIDAQTVGRAFLGGARALTNEGEIVTLISTGMADFEFTSNGGPVTFIKDNSAVIEMDLISTTGADGRSFAAGDSIDMWWFDEEKGVWIEDGIGRVEESEQSPTGLKLITEVTHFTTWNWDYYPDRESRANFEFSCSISGQPMAQDQNCLLDIKSAALSSQYVVGADGLRIVNGPGNVTFDVRATLKDGNGYYAGSKTFVSSPGDNVVVVELEPKTTEEASVRCKVINGIETRVKPCEISIYGSIVDSFNTADSANFVSQFGYAPGDQFDITATLENGNSQTISIDTDLVNGYLDMVITFEVAAKRLTCVATLDAANREYIPCEAIIEDDMGGQQVVWRDAFSGDPLGADFTFSRDALSLDIEVASDLDPARIRYQEFREKYYMSGDGQRQTVDLGTLRNDVVFDYSISSGDLYEFKCIDENGNEPEDCYVTWYTPMEAIAFDGWISELDSAQRLPTWLQGQIHAPEARQSFGNARMQGATWSYSNHEIVSTPTGQAIKFFVKSDEAREAELNQ